MDVWTTQVTQTTMIDAHVHMGEDEARIRAILEATSIDKMVLVAIQNPAAGTGLPQALWMKARYPETFYVFAGLNHAQALSEGAVTTLSLVEQVEAFAAMGCDGIKMIEGKPTSRRRMNIPVTAPYYADYWARVEALGLPIVWHVNDPEEFWVPDRLPAWARERNWGYGPEDVQKEELYAEVNEVLARHPDLKITFAHFYFLSADLARAGRLLDAHPTVNLDLTPGIEMLYNISRDPEAGRDFFLRYADRIIFGTDIASSQTVEEARLRAGIVIRWLESDDTFTVPKGADFLLGRPEDGTIRGLALPDDVLAKIYHDNVVRLVGERPRALDVDQAAAYTNRLAAVAQGMTGTPAEETPAARVARKLRQIA
jgi:predicted TIM-barrel fold metal-dependent hydrolase